MEWYQNSGEETRYVNKNNNDANVSIRRVFEKLFCAGTVIGTLYVLHTEWFYYAILHFTNKAVEAQVAYLICVGF